ncbi:MAG: glycosyltransferase family 2 protein [Ruminococcus sp.]|nr:glycosyltransferase family 2 protein [Ruminococcus sp.]
MNSLIDIIIPIYNVELYLSRCLDELFGQFLSDFRLILVDDGSYDAGGEICDEYILKDSRIIIIHKNNGGLSDARNVGLDCYFASSDSEWITFIDSDDWVHPLYLEALYNAVKDSGLKISSCNIKRTSQYGIDNIVNTGYTIESAEDVYTQFGEKALSYAVARLYHRSLFEKIRFPKGKLFEDVFTSYKVFLSVDKIAYVEAPLYYYFYNENGIVHQKWSPKRMDEFDAYEEQLEYLSQHPEFIKTYVVIQRDYMQEISYSYFMLQQSDYEYKDYYLDILSDKMRSALKKYGKSAGITIKEHTNYYEIARLKRVNFFWKYQALKRKLIKR